MPPLFDLPALLSVIARYIDTRVHAPAHTPAHTRIDARVDTRIWN